MKKPRLVAKDVAKVVHHQAESTAVLRALAEVLTRGFWGRMRWLLLGR